MFFVSMALGFYFVLALSVYCLGNGSVTGKHFDLQAGDPSLIFQASADSMYLLSTNSTSMVASIPPIIDTIAVPSCRRSVGAGGHKI